MKTDIWMPWYISDYEKDTKALSLEEDCIYRRALDYLWQNPAGLPWDTVRLSRCLRLTEEESKRLKWVLDEYLEKRGDKYYSERVNKEYAKALQRAEIARENGKKGGRPNKEEKPSGIPSGLAKRNPTLNPDHNPEKSSPQSPSPSQSQSTTDSNSVDNTHMSNREKEHEERKEKKRQELELLKKQEFEIFQYWQISLDHSKCLLDQKRSTAIRARLKEGYTVERIKEAIDGIKNSPHNMGQNERNTVFDDIELICRSGANVDRFAEKKKKGKYAKSNFEKRAEGLLSFTRRETSEASIRGGHFGDTSSLPSAGDRPNAVDDNV